MYYRAATSRWRGKWRQLARLLRRSQEQILDLGWHVESIERTADRSLRLCDKVDGPDARTKLLIGNQKIGMIVAQAGTDTKIFERRKRILKVGRKIGSRDASVENKRIVQIKFQCLIADLMLFSFVFISLTETNNARTKLTSSPRRFALPRTSVEV